MLMFWEVTLETSSDDPEYVEALTMNLASGMLEAVQEVLADYDDVRVRTAEVSPEKSLDGPTWPRVWFNPEVTAEIEAEIKAKATEEVPNPA